MIRINKLVEERRECGSMECWLLHGAVGSASDWRSFASRLAAEKIGSRAVDLWRFLEDEPMSMDAFGLALNAEATATRKRPRVLVGYSMGGRLALHALLQPGHPWDAAVLLSTHPGLESDAARAERCARDAAWATRALTLGWTDFLTDWQAQPVLAGASIRDASASSRLAQRRREIARSFIDWSLGTQRPRWDELATISIPVLWIAGSDDVAYVERAKRAASSMPHARVAIAPACGHRVPWHAEDWLADEVARFSAAAPPPTPTKHAEERESPGVCHDGSPALQPTRDDAETI
jgi:2-succinyl-6-hydroxy-2,4-cyclohexadiene-1-carboxylate synthase